MANAGVVSAVAGSGGEMFGAHALHGAGWAAAGIRGARSAPRVRRRVCWTAWEDVRRVPAAPEAVAAGRQLKNVRWRSAGLRRVDKVVRGGDVWAWDVQVE